MRARSIPLAIILLAPALIAVLAELLFPPETIVYPTDVKASAPVRRTPPKLAMPANVEGFLPRETSSDHLSPATALPEHPAQVQQMLESNSLILESAKSYLESHGNSDEAQRAVVNRGFQRYMGRAPLDSEEQAGLSALREMLKP